MKQMGSLKQQEAVGEASRPGEAAPVQPSLTALAARRHAVVGKTDHPIIVECRDFAYAAAGTNRTAQWGGEYQTRSKKQTEQEPDGGRVGASAFERINKCQVDQCYQPNPGKHLGPPKPAVPPELPPVPCVSGDVVIFITAKAIFHDHEHVPGNLPTKK